MVGVIPFSKLHEKVYKQLRSDSQTAFEVIVVGTGSMGSSAC